MLRFFSSRSWHTFDADCVCKSFYDSRNEKLYTALKNIFGGEIFTADGNVDRAALAKRVFNDPEKMKELTDYSYPKIGSLIGKDHSTAIYAIKKVNELMEKEKLKQPYEDIRLEICAFASQDVIATSGFGDSFTSDDSWA